MRIDEVRASPAYVTDRSGSPTTRTRLVARYKSGGSVKSLARAFGIHRNTVTIQRYETPESRNVNR